jgi:hypothetical protein
MSRSRSGRTPHKATQVLTEKETSAAEYAFSQCKDALRVPGSEGSQVFHQSLMRRPSW